MVEKGRKDLEQYKKTFIEFKGRATKFYKSCIISWVKAVLQPKNKRKSAAVTQ